MEFAALAYGVVLLLGALGVIAVGAYEQEWRILVVGVVCSQLRHRTQGCAA